MTSRTTAIFQNDGTNGILRGESGSGETLTMDRANGSGMSAGEMLLMSMASCTLGTVKEYLVAHEIEAGSLRVEASCSFDERDQRYVDFELVLKCNADTPARTQTAMLNAAKTCRISRTLHGGPNIAVALEASL